MSSPEKTRFTEKLHLASIPLIATTTVIGALVLLAKGCNAITEEQAIRIPDNAQEVDTRQANRLSWIVKSIEDAQESDCGGETIKFFIDNQPNQNDKEIHPLGDGTRLLVCKLANPERTPQIEEFTPSS